jgi:hypothetical protein
MGPSKVVQAPGQLRWEIGKMEVFVFRNKCGTLPGRRTAITSVLKNRGWSSRTHTQSADNSKASYTVCETVNLTNFEQERSSWTKFGATRGEVDA